MVTREIFLGPPGTGKTTTLLREVEAELAAGTKPQRVGFVSFTKRAAREAAERAAKSLGLDNDELRNFRTLHSVCFQSLGFSRADVLERARLREFAAYAGIEVSERYDFDLEGSTFGFKQGDRALFMENLARVRGVTLREQYDLNDDNLMWREVDRVSTLLAEFKRARHLVDYTDMLSQFAESSIDLRLDVLFVDEAQDLSHLQWAVVRKLAHGCRRVVIAGDDDQAIYRWAGADVDHFISLRGKVRVLGQSWRVPTSIQQLSSEIVSRVEHRRPKEWRPRDEEGQVDRVASFGDVDMSGQDVLVLARNNFVLEEQVIPELRRQGVIFEAKTGRSVRPTLLQAILTWEHLRRGEAAAVSDVKRVYEYMSSGVGVSRGHKSLPGRGDEDLVTMETLRGDCGLLVEGPWHEAMDRIPKDEMNYVRSARRRGESLRRSPRVRISTIHGAKGGEADHVVLLTEMAARTHDEMGKQPDDEARVWYVAVTRARRQLTIVGSRSRLKYHV